MGGMLILCDAGAELNALREFDEEIRIYKGIAQEKFARGEGRPKAQEVGAVKSGTSEQMIREEEGVERAAVDRHRVVVQ